MPLLTGVRELDDQHLRLMQAIGLVEHGMRG